jgi:hypothetical protein
MQPHLSPSDVARFWAKIDRSGGPDACWRWLGTFDQNGYGLVGWRKDGTRHTTTAHRVALFLTNGHVDEERKVLHCCPGGSNRWCINPAHLYEGTAADNASDREREGRTARGERNGHVTKPERTPRGDRHGSCLHPETRERGDDHWTHRLSARLSRGERHHAAKLSNADVEIIRQRRAAGERTSTLAAEYGVSVPHLSRIVNGHTRITYPE